jgi:hypothetical protein
MDTSETEFYLINDCNAYANTNLNTISIGLPIFTLETIIHEINEIVLTSVLMRDAGANPRVSLNNGYNFLSHFLSPFGEKSLIYEAQFKTRFDETEGLVFTPVGEEFLLS